MYNDDYILVYESFLCLLIELKLYRSHFKNSVVRLSMDKTKVVLEVLDKIHFESVDSAHNGMTSITILKISCALT